MRSNRALLNAGSTTVLAVAAVLVANDPAVQSTIAGTVPLVGRLPTQVLSGTRLATVILVTTATVTVTMFDRYIPRPQRALDTAFETIRGMIVATCALATLGYFDYSYRLPRLTLIVAMTLLFVALPVLFVGLHLRRRTNAGRTVVVGKDPERIASAVKATAAPVVGYIYSPNNSPAAPEAASTKARYTTDGGSLTTGPLADYDSLGGLSQLEEVLLKHDIGRTIVALSEADRAEFFGVLRTCHDKGVTVTVHREHVDSVLPLNRDSELVTVNIEPLNWYERLVKRVFDVAFAGIGLLVLAPVLLLVSVAIKVDTPGSVFYSQDRTAELGETFHVYKFRSMVVDAEAKTGAKVSEEDAGGVDPRVTRVGRVIRETHLDEVPQLWSVLVGKMSVVGPRPERPEIESDIEREVGDWRKRWFIKPGLTGLAQVRGATGYEPDAKLRYDLEYIRRQSFWFDLKIVLWQVGQVVRDVAELVTHKSN
jgi:exopolysaccharide biosynthesis polyprenyl glycosylphosphotransferase